MGKPSLTSRSKFLSQSEPHLQPHLASSAKADLSEYYVHLSKTEEFASLMSLLPPGTQLVSNYLNRLLVIQTPSPLSEGRLAKLRATKFVLAFETNVRLEHQDTAADSHCLTPMGINPSQFTLNETANLLKYLRRAGNCLSVERCSSDALARPDEVGTAAAPLVPSRIAHEAIDSELMFDEMANHSDLQPSQVAVLEGGVESRLNSHFLTPLKYRDGFQGAANPTHDHEQHGSKVSSIISGSYGIGQSPKSQVTIYGIARNDTKRVNLGEAKIAALKACVDGNKIINLSYGYSNIDDTMFETGDPAFAKELKSKGCLLVKANGNLKSQADINNFNADDAILRVAANDPIKNSLMVGYPQGEIHAPGSGVLTFSERESAQSCNLPVANELTPGSSVAAPIVTAVASNVRSLLATSVAFRGLSGEKQVELLIHILKASEVGDSVNGYQAVRLASHWLKQSNPAQINSVQDLKVLRLKISTCDPKPNPCVNSGCLQQKSCLKVSRKYLLDCSNPNPQVLADTINTYWTNGEFEMANLMAKYSNKDSAIRQKIEQETLRLPVSLNQDFARFRQIEDLTQRIEGLKDVSFPKAIDGQDLYAWALLNESTQTSELSLKRLKSEIKQLRDQNQSWNQSQIKSKEREVSRIEAKNVCQVKFRSIIAQLASDQQNRPMSAAGFASKLASYRITSAHKSACQYQDEDLSFDLETPQSIREAIIVESPEVQAQKVNQLRRLSTYQIELKELLAKNQNAKVSLAPIQF
jgi:hypothetical protein